MEQKSSGRNTAEGVNMPATPKTKAEIEQELLELRIALSYVFRYEQGDLNETNWHEWYPNWDYNTANQYYTKWFTNNWYDPIEAIKQLAGYNEEGTNSILQQISDEVQNIPEPQPETVYVVREDSVMSKLNLILSSV